MSTFCAVSDDELRQAISQATRRVVYVAPGISGVVAGALKARFEERPDRLDVTVVLDPDEDVCRIGYGDQAGLVTLQELVSANHLSIRKQTGLRIGVLMADDVLLIWAPTPQSVEAAPKATEQPNGLRLGPNPAALLEKAIAPEGTDTVPSAGEIGKSAVAPDEVQQTIKALDANPVIPVDLSQVTRVFSTKLQFVELEVKGAKFSKTGLSVPGDQMNVDAPDALRGLIDAKLRAFDDIRYRQVDVPAFTRAGDAVLGPDGKQKMEAMSEADLEAVRREIERRFLFSIRGHGTLVAKDQKREFEKRLKSYTTQIQAHATGLRGFVKKEANSIVDDAVNLVTSRATHAVKGKVNVDADALRKSLEEAIERLVQGQPSVTKRYKDVTFDHTQSAEFRELVRKALPADVLKRLGHWDEHFKATKELPSGK
jgi:hypothetical protein